MTDKPNFKLKGIVPHTPNPDEKIAYYTGVRSDPHLDAPSLARAEEILEDMRRLYEGDEMGMPVFLAGDYADGAGLKQIAGEKVIHCSTPTGRDTSAFIHNALERMQSLNPHHRRVNPFWPEPLPINIDFADYEKQIFNKGFAAGRESLFMPVIVNPRRMNQQNVENLLYDMEAPVDQNAIMRMSKMLWDSITDLSSATRPHWSYTGEGKESYDRMKAEYELEFGRSKLAGDERHEHICRKMLRPVKKRRKAFRKLLDHIRSEVDGDRDTKGSASDRNGKRGQRSSHAPRLPHK